MITIITSITSQEGFETLKRSLYNFEPDWKLGLDLLCFVHKQELYLECRNFLLDAVDRGECLVVYEEKKTLKVGREYLSPKNEFVFLLNEGVLVPFGGIGKLYKDYFEKNTAGFICGVEKDIPQVFWVKDIYGCPQYIYSNNDNLAKNGLVEVDVSNITGMLTKTSLYEELFCYGDLDGYGSLSYGIRLRRQGYKNFIDTRVEYGGRR